MYRSFLFGIVFLLAIIALTACGTSAPTVTPTLVPPTTTSTNTPVPTDTPTPTNTPKPTNTPRPTDSLADTTVLISASSEWNGIPVWKYTATATVKNTSSSSALIPQGSVTFHFSDRAAVNRDESCNLGSDGSCSVVFTDSIVYYIVSATYQPTGNFNGSASGSVGTGR
jgi:hypothetical protein